MGRGRTARVLVQRIETEGADAPRIYRRPDELIVEEPLEIRLDGHLVTTTMRTPGDDFELAAADGSGTPTSKSVVVRFESPSA